MFTLNPSIMINFSVSHRGDKKGDKKGEISPHHPHIVFDHIQTINSDIMKNHSQPQKYFSVDKI